MNNQETHKPAAIVVNDDPTQLAILAGLLGKVGVKARAYEGVEAALAAMSQADPPGLVVTDLYMPGIDGWRFCRLLRSPEYAAFNKVPILIVSATFAGDHPESIAADAGADAFLPAPVDGKAFTAQALALLDGQKVRHQPRALIVEDDKALTLLLRKVFAAHGYQEDAATTIREAEAVFAAVHYDVAVLDYHLPDGTAGALLDAFRAARPDCACVMMTGDPSPELALDWMKRGAAAILHKPFSPEVLIELCGRARRERALLRTEDLLEVRTRELRENEAKYRGLFAATPDGIWVHGADGVILDANETMCRRIGLSHEAILGRNVRDFITPTSAAGMSVNVRDALEGRVCVFETAYFSSDGTTVEVEVRERLIPWGTGTAILCISRDITDRKRAEEAERRDRVHRDLIGRMATEAIKATHLERFLDGMLRLLGEALDVSRTYVFTYRHDTKTMDNNAEWTAPGVPPQKDKLQGIPADTEWWWITTLKRGEDIRFADVAEMPDARTREEMRSQGIRSILVIPLFIGTRFCGFMGFDECRSRREWTQRERDMLTEAAHILMGVWADEDLKHSEKRFRGILQNVATVAVQGYAMDGAVHYWNRASETFYGYTAEEAVGRNLLDLIIPPAMRDDVRASIRHMAETGDTIPATELTLMRKDSSPIHVYTSHALVQVPGGDTELYCIDVDLTERKRAEAEREKLQAQLAQAQKMESVGRLAGGVAHDFNNMLQVVMGTVEMALDRVGPDDPLRDELENIRKASLRSAGLTQQLLAFARKQTVAPKVLDLNETVECLLKMLRRFIGEDIALVWNPGANLWPVRMDPTQVDSILVNLCVNARDAITGTGRIALDTVNAVLGEDFCSRHPGCLPGDYVLLSVRDDGCGMDDGTLSHLFEPFFTTKAQGKGSGLGLASVHGAVAQNGGGIDVSSAPGRGTTFRIYLPRHATSAAQGTEEGKSQPATRGGETILLVEDEPDILRMAATMLKRLGYAVLAAASPGEAIRLAREHRGRIDLLMTDVVMPEMNGRDLARNLLAIHPDIRRLFMSGYTADVIAHQGVLDEGVHFIQKPFSKMELAEQLRKALE